MKKLVVVALVVLLGSFALGADDQPKESKAVDRVQAAADVLNEIQSAPDSGIPGDILSRADCVAVVPSMLKGGFIVGGKYGRGLASCRTPKGWSAPAFFTVAGGSFGFQIGGSETDVIMLVMNDRGAQRMLESQFTLGAEGEVAAGPVGRDATAQTDAKFTAEILSWSRSRGIFAGIALKGATLRQDIDDNQALYGKRLENREIVAGAVKPNGAGRKLIAALDRRSPQEHK